MKVYFILWNVFFMNIFPDWSEINFEVIIKNNYQWTKWNEKIKWRKIIALTFNDNFKPADVNWIFRDEIKWHKNHWNLKSSSYFIAYYCIRFGLIDEEPNCMHNNNKTCPWKNHINIHCQKMIVETFHNLLWFRITVHNCWY